jgi:excisionase family DNA binding protein
MEPLALSINDTARTLGPGRTSIYAMIADGRLDAFRLGRRRLVLMDSTRPLLFQGAQVRTFLESATKLANAHALQVNSFVSTAERHVPPREE